MIMKFKVGDKVRCVLSSAAIGVHVGKVYTVKGYNKHCRTYGCVLLVEVDSSPFETCFELVQEDAVLTPEEVFDHLRKGTKLQYRPKLSKGWVDQNQSGSPVTDNPTFKMITLGDWRIKPEPEVIELNGKKYREIVE